MGKKYRNAQLQRLEQLYIFREQTKVVQFLETYPFLVPLLLFDWSGYLILAQELANQATGSSIQEAKLRCAISRAYFAAFCTARNHLRYKEQRSIPHSGRVHQTVIELFEKSHDPAHQIVGQFLRNLRSNRNMADYENRIANLTGIARGTLAQAEQVLSLLKVL